MIDDIDQIVITLKLPVKKKSAEPMIVHVDYNADLFQSAISTFSTDVDSPIYDDYA